MDTMIPALYRVEKVRRETADTFTLALKPKNGGGKFDFAAGQFNMLYAIGKGEVPISISGDPDDGRKLLHTIRAAGAVTRALVTLKPGQVLGLRGPFGTSWPVQAAEGSDVLIVAGGIGLAPLRPAVYRILTHRRKYGRVALLYGARNPKDILFMSELKRWRGRFDIDVALTVDHADSGWRNSVGVVTRLIPRAGVDAPHTVAMVCGPEVMMRYTVQELLERGVEAESIYVSMERNMKCGIGLCGHCQYGCEFICKDGPVFPFSRLRAVFNIREL